MHKDEPRAYSGSEIAVIGMAGRFPRARSIEEFWRNLDQAVECITFFERAEMEAAGVPSAALDNPLFVGAGGVVEDYDLFDAAFFGFSPREAEITDPQQRLFLECAWEALENAGYDSDSYTGAIGVYAGAGMSAYLINVYSNSRALQTIGHFRMALGNDKDYLPTWVSYKLNLRGPSVNANTACSTSLVTVHLACQSLLSGECDIALAGGSRIRPENGYFYQQGGILSPDGHCRAFDSKAGGTVGGNGVALVVLKRLADALADGDTIHAVILGSAINNDGSQKAGFTAPSVDGQTKVIAEALSVSGVDPETITYIETHGTGTELGDPVEIEALTHAFRAYTDRKGFCAVGAVKSNVGHLDAVAGVAGFIKAVLALEHRRIPASLHFEEPNPAIDFANSPFYVNAESRDWEKNGSPLRAGVSAFGIGGTNAHVVLEEAPETEPSSDSRDWQLLVLSARTATALERLTENLIGHLEQRPKMARADFADLVYTLQVGRKGFNHRRMLVTDGSRDALDTLCQLDPNRVLTYSHEGRHRPVVFMFPGGGAQYPGMGADLYRSEPVFRREIDACARLLQSHVSFDFRELLFSKPAEEAEPLLRRTSYALPALFAVEYATARLWMEWGIRPQALIGHSLGEYVAACIAGSMRLEDALMIVALRGRLFEELPGGAMLGVPLTEAAAAPYVDDRISIAAINTPSHCVFSGDAQAIDALEEKLSRDGIEVTRIHIDVAAHSAMVEPLLERFQAFVATVPLSTPSIPFLSNVTGTWITPADATDPAYWVRHLRQTVRFADGLSELFADRDRIFLEVGPGRTLGLLAARHPKKDARHLLLSSLRHPQDRSSDVQFLLSAVGRLWLAGVRPDWNAFYAEERRRRVPLPTYPFERQRYWIEAVRATAGASAGAGTAAMLAAEEEPQAEGMALVEVEETALSLHMRPVLQSAYAAPRGETEARVAKIWQALLGVEPVGIHDNFFELGGHSLLLVQLVSRLRDELEIQIPMRSLADAPTVSELALLIQESQSEQLDLPASVLPVLVPDPENRYQPFPLTEVQEAYWIGRNAGLELGNTATQIYTEFESRQLDLERFQRAWRRLIERHDMLRAIFLPDGRQQVLESTPPYEIAVTDLRGLPHEAVQERLAALRRQMPEQIRPADRWPLFEVRACLLDDERVRVHTTMDYLLVDGWSIELLRADLARFYADPELELPPFEISYRDYVVAEVAFRESEVYERSLDYWMRRLPTLPSGPELPLAKNPAALAKPRFVRRQADLGEEAWSRLKSRAARAGLTPSGVLMAAYSEVLGAWSKTSRFLVNLTLFNRYPIHPQVDEILGDFTSLVLLEVDTSLPGTFEERAQRVQRQLWEDLDHRYVSGVRVQRELMRARGGALESIAPVVFTSAVSVQRERSASAPANPGGGGLSGQSVYGIGATPQVWIDHGAGEDNGVLHFAWDAVDELFPAGLLQEVFDAYVGLLERLAEGEEAWQERPRLLPAAQRELMAAANATEAPRPEGLLHAPFAARAAADPERVAVIASGRTLTYGELSDLANRLGHRLRAAGASPNRLVAVVMEKGWEQVAAVLGVLQAGAAYLPIDPELPAERLAYLLAHGEVDLALTQSQWDAKLAWPAGIERIRVDSDDLSGFPSAPPAPVASPQDLAYVIFTSGSTGQPKGVMIEHGAALNTVVDINRRFALGTDDRVLALSALNFDLSVYDIFGILAAGGAIVMPDAAASREPEHWADLVARHGVTIWDSVPALMKMLVDAVPGSPIHGLRLVLLSGDWIPVHLPAQIRSLAPDAEVVSLGGATEVSIWSILFPIGEVDPAWTSIPYGRAMANQSFHVLNAALEPCPVWVPGQLFIGGVGLARGYWRDEVKTAASFIVHSETGERLYRTGDLGRFLPDGQIEFLGREDFQVKIQGFRIELGEIEVALAGHPAVANAVVVASGEKRGEKRLVAYVVPAGHGRTASEEPSIALAGRPVGRDGALPVAATLSYSLEQVSAEQLGTLLESLGEISFNGGPRFRYPSPTGTYPVRAYVYVKPERVEGLAGGVYRYQPAAHRLVPVATAADLQADAFGRQAGLFEQSAFAIVLGAEPVAGRAMSRDLCLIEAGAMAQLLLSAGDADGLGLQPVEGLEPELLQPALGVEEGYQLLFSLLGGRPEEDPPHPMAADGQPSAPQPVRILEDPDGLADALRSHLEGKLPRYMVPASFVFLDALPLSANGKVDRQALPSQELAAGDRQREMVAPSTPLEHALARIWQEVLGLAEVGVEDSFFEAGGHSLLAARLVARVRETLRVRLSLASIFEAPTIAGMAAQVEKLRAEGSSVDYAGGDLPTLEPQPESWYEPFPLTELQQAYWIGRTGAFELGNVAPQMYLEFETVDLDVARFELALQRTIERHTILRAVVLSSGRQQILREVPPYRVEVVDLREIPQEAQAAAFAALRKHLAEDPIAIDQWPLLRVRVSRLGARRWCVHITISLLICDAWGNSIFAKELQHFYVHPDAVLEPLAITFRDYVIALQGLEVSALYQQSLSYWRGRLATLPQAPELPLATNPAALTRPRFVRRTGTLDRQAWWRFKQRARQAGLTPDGALCALYSEVLAAWSKRQHFLLNILYFNRLHLHPQVGSILGNFSSTVLLEVDLRREGTFIDRARGVQEQLWRDLEHSAVSGVRVLRELNRLQGTSARVTVPVVFASAVGLGTRETSPEEPPSSEGEPSPFPPGHLQTPQVWLDHQVLEEMGVLGFNWDAVEDLFPPGLVQEMFDAYCSLLHRLSAPDSSAWQEREGGLVPAAQLELFRAVNETAAPLADDRLQDLFAAQVERRRDEPAVVAAGRVLTYGELDRRSARLAHELRELGARPDQLVAVVLEKGWEQVVAVLGILRSGAAYLPLDPGLPAERFRYLLEKGEAALAVTRPALADGLDWPAGVRCLTIDETEPAGQEPPPPVQGPDDLAYVIFTSGSTGLPKGVMIDHRGAVNTVLDINERFGVGPEDRVLALSSLAFDLSVYDVFGLLAAGGAVVMPDSADLREPSRWVELIEREGVTVWNSVPALAQMLADYLAERSERLPSSLRLVMLSGDWVPVTLPDRLRALGDVEVVSLGGATEASIWSILYPVEEVDPAWPSIPYGRPMRNQKWYVLNEALEPCPVWVPGHLYIAGTGLARGYWRDEERTAASFFLHPRTQERLYRTGDLGRYLPDGDIEFLGREDLQVKIQGYRIELGEIEAALARHPGVRSSAVIAVGEKHGAKSLVAYGVPEPHEQVTADDLRIFLQAALPEYMVPHTLVLLPDLPLTGNGKVDRGALAALSTAQSGDAAQTVPPRDDLELELTSLWEQLLAVGRVGIRDNFFDLGGHSLLAVRLMAQIERRFGRNLPLSILFEGATVEHLAAVLRQEIGALRRAPLVRIQPGGDRPPFFCVHPVGGSVLCYLDLARQLGPEQPFYGLQVADGQDETRQDSIETMAAAYIDAMRAVQPSGPYRLGGWSMGGVVAFEMARKLREAGEEVALLALIDATAQEGTPDDGLDDAAMLAAFAADLARLSGEQLSIQPDELRGRPFEEVLPDVVARISASGALPPEVGFDEARRFFEVYRTNLNAMLRYRPGSYEGDVVVFRAADENTGAEAADPALGWDRVVAGRLTSEPIPGDHYTIMREPLVGQVAEQLRAHFDAAAGHEGESR